MQANIALCPTFSSSSGSRSPSARIRASRSSPDQKLQSLVSPDASQTDEKEKKDAPISPHRPAFKLSHPPVSTSCLPATLTSSPPLLAKPSSGNSSRSSVPLTLKSFAKDSERGSPCRSTEDEKRVRQYLFEQQGEDD